MTSEITPQVIVPIVTEAAKAPTRLTDFDANWIAGAELFQDGNDIALYLAKKYPVRPAVQEMNSDDPRVYLSPVYDISYLAGHDHRLGIVLEMPLSFQEDKTIGGTYTHLGARVECLPSEKFVELTARLQADLDTVARKYPAFEFSLAHGEATALGDLVIRAFRPLGPIRKLTGDEHDEVFEVEEAITDTENLSLPA